MFAGPLCGVSGWFQLEFVHNVNAAEIGNGRTANEFERRLFLSDATNIHLFRFRFVRSFVRSSVSPSASPSLRMPIFSILHLKLMLKLINK